jgi:hypothetical protein
MQPIDSVDQTIEKLMTTIKHLHDLADKAIDNVNSVACQSVCRKELDEIMEKHYNQY